jgi:hypothetical protein
MSWSIVRVYTLPAPTVIDHFKNMAEAEVMYLINDLKGIRSDFSKNVIFSDVPTEHSHKRHGLPNGGLLAIVPDIDTNYFGRRVDETKMTPVTNDYGDIKKLSKALELNISHYNLFFRLKQLNEKTGVPIMYYQSATWGGMVDDELSVVFDGGIFVYWHNWSIKKVYQLKRDFAFEIETSVLQKGLQHIGLSLPTHYFALHESPFDWNRYAIWHKDYD